MGLVSNRSVTYGASSPGITSADRLASRARVWRAVVFAVSLWVVALAPAGSLARGSAGHSSLAGRLIGFPAPSRTVLVDVEAISLRNATVVAVTVPVRGRYSMSVPPGPYLVVARVSDLRAGRTVTRSGHAALVGSSPRTVNIGAASDGGRVRAHAATGGATVGIGRIPLSVDIPGYRPGGSVEGGLINGLLPGCQADGGKLVDESKLVKDAEKAEQRLSDEGRTATKFQLNPLTADLVINGQVKVDANGKPIADIQVVDPKTGKVVDHIVVAGDPEGILDLGPFLRHVGTGIGVRVCKPRRKPKPKPRPPGGTSSCRKLHRKQLCFVFDGSISAQGIDKSVNSNSYAGDMKARIVWLITYPGHRLQGGSELMQGADPALSSASGSTDFSSPFAVCGRVLSYRAAVTAGIPLSDANSSDGNAHWTVHVPNVLFGSAPDGSFPANGTCTNPIQPTDPPYDGAALYTFRERGATGDGFEFINFHFSTHQRTTTVRYPRVSRTETDSSGSTSTVAWSGTITAVMGPGVS